MVQDTITIVLDGSEAVELGEALIDAGWYAQSTGDRHSVEFVRSKAVALPFPEAPKIEIERSEINFQVRP